MAKEKAAYEVKPYPLSRRLIIDSGRTGRRQHTITAMVDVDVTEARQIMHRYKARSGESLSFTGFIIYCLGQAIDQNRYLHARRDIWGRLILFEEVDCTVMIEIEFQGQKFPLAHILRGVNKRSFASIHKEIRGVQQNTKASESMQRNQFLIGAFLLLPAFLRDIFYRVAGRAPQLFKQQVGTVMVTAVGMFGSGAGWGLTYGSPYTCSVLLGGIEEKPGVVDGEIGVREYLSLTVDFDHDIVDGAPAARFLNRFKGYAESASGLEEYRE